MSKHALSSDILIVRPLWAQILINLNRWVIFIAILVSTIQFIQFCKDYIYISELTSCITKNDSFGGDLAKIKSIREYLLNNVSYVGAQNLGRPILRDNAADTLRTGKGYCGEVTRAFICMAFTQHIKARRVYLYNPGHVVAEAIIGSNAKVMVDCQNPPFIKEIESAELFKDRDHIIESYNINLSRLPFWHGAKFVECPFGILAFFLENPYLLRLSFLMSIAFICAGQLVILNAYFCESKVKSKGDASSLALAAQGSDRQVSIPRSPINPSRKIPNVMDRS